MALWHKKKELQTTRIDPVAIKFVAYINKLIIYFLSVY